MSKFLEAMNYPTGVQQEVQGVRFTPTEPPVGKYVAVRGGLKFQVQNPDGSWTPEAFNTVITCASGPAVLLWDRERDIVGVTEEFRLPAFLRDISDSKAGKSLNRPAGRVMTIAMGAKLAEETMSEAAIREALDETGCSIEMLQTLVVFDNQAISADQIGLSIALFDSSKGKHGSETGLKSEGELIKFLMMPSTEFIDRALHGDFDTIGMAVAFLFQNERQKFISQQTLQTTLPLTAQPADLPVPKIA